MQVDFNQPKNRAFNIFIRVFQLSIQLIAGYWASKHQFVEGCNNNIPNITSYLAYVLAALNLTALIAIRFSKKFPRFLFISVYIIDFAITLAIIIVQAVRSRSQCAAAKVYELFSMIESITAIVVSIVILLVKLIWGQRYTNAPGNVVWPFLFLSYQWNSRFHVIMFIIGISTAVVSVTTFLIHLPTWFRTQTWTKKFLTTSWVIGISILILMEGLALVVYLKVENLTQFIDVQAKRTLGIFGLVNILDILFWIWGIRTLEYEKNEETKHTSFGEKQDYRSTRIVNEQSILVSHEVGPLS